MPVYGGQRLPQALFLGGVACFEVESLTALEWTD